MRILSEERERLERLLKEEQARLDSLNERVAQDDCPEVAKALAPMFREVSEITISELKKLLGHE